MPNLLYINSSARNKDSISRQVADVIAGGWGRRHGDTSIMTRDLTAQPVPHVDEATATAFFTPPPFRTPALEMALARSDSLVYELRRADILLIASSMYNLTVSSSLKAWIDHVCRAGITFKYTPDGPVGLLKRKKAIVVTARGGVFLEGPAKALDFQQPYLRSMFAIYLGITEVEFVTVEGFAMGPEAAKRAIGAAMARAAAIAESL